MSAMSSEDQGQKGFSIRNERRALTRMRFPFIVVILYIKHLILKAYKIRVKTS